MAHPDHHQPTNTVARESHNGQPVQADSTPMAQGELQGSKAHEKTSHEPESDEVQEEEPIQTTPIPPQQRECQEAARPDHTHQKQDPGAFLPYLYKLLHIYPPSGKAVGVILFVIFMLFRTLTPAQPGQAGYYPHHRTPTAASPIANASYSPVGYLGQPPHVAPRNLSLRGPQCPETREISPHRIKFDGLQEARASLTRPAKGGVQDRPAVPPPPAECQETVPSFPRHLRGNTGPSPRAHRYQHRHTHSSRDPGQPPPRNQQNSA